VHRLGLGREGGGGASWRNPTKPRLEGEVTGKMAEAMASNLYFWSDAFNLRAAKPLQQQGFVYTFSNFSCCLPAPFVLIGAPYSCDREALQSCKQCINTAGKKTATG
jgi:hypothetical protein